MWLFLIAIFTFFFFLNQTVSLAHQYLEFWGAFKTSMDADIGAYPHAIASVVSYL